MSMFSSIAVEGMCNQVLGWIEAERDESNPELIAALDRIAAKVEDTRSSAELGYE